MYPLEAQSSFKDLKHEQSLVLQILYLREVFADFILCNTDSLVVIIYPPHGGDYDVKGRKSSEEKIFEQLEQVWVIEQFLKHQEEVAKAPKHRVLVYLAGVQPWYALLEHFGLAYFVGVLRFQNQLL